MVSWVAGELVGGLVSRRPIHYHLRWDGHADSTLVAIVPGMQNTKNLIVAEHAERLALAVYRSY